MTPAVGKTWQFLRSRKAFMMIDPLPAIHPAVTLETILSTAELIARPSRPPDYKTENRALLEIARHMADSPRTILQKLAEVALQVCRAGSAGVSLVSEDTGDFYWPAIAGLWQPHIGGGTPRNFGPCGVVLDRNAGQLFTHPERFYPYLVPVSPPIAEMLLTPFSVEGKPVGTLWVIAHEASRQFDAEDMRLIESLGQLAAAAYPLSATSDTQELRSHSMRDVNESLLLSSLRQHELAEQAQKAEAALREIEERLRLAGEAARVGTWRLDLTSRLETRDANLNRLLDLDPVDSVQPIDDFLGRLHPDDKALVEDEINRAGRARDPYKVECRVILPDGAVLWLLVQGYVTLVAGEPRYIAGAAVDITLQKGVEKTLRMANQELEQFGFSASHDLQEPIRNIAVYAQMIDKFYGHLLDPQGKDFLAFIMSGAKRLDMLLRDLRSYAASGATREPRQEVRADSVLAKALLDLSWAIEESHAEISHSELPTVWTHEVQLHQIFQNLIGNAIKYRQDNEPPRIHIGAERKYNQWMFSVRDNGIGIAQEHQVRIFGLFKRLHGGDKYSGSGIGLAICQKIVERNGGLIWVESEGRNKGSTFYFTLHTGEVRQTE
jgi:signal transduction histidine kinase